MKPTFYLQLIILFAFATFLNGCTDTEEEPQSTTQSIVGYVQKGPFLNGSSVTVYDLNSFLNPTGISFNTQITNNQGKFSLEEIPLSSNVIRVRADGFYYNEVLGKQSNSQLTLYAISDITRNSTINVNLLTHLEKARVEYLLQDNEITFSEAKKQAQREILAIFNIDKDSVDSSEKLDISEEGDDNGILLAVTSILQAFRSESQLSELLANISNDILEDGLLDDTELGSALINQAVYLDSAGIKANLEKRYNDIGGTATVPSFGKHIKNFIEKTPFQPTEMLIKYPSTGLHGTNILDVAKVEYFKSTTGKFSLAAQLPTGTALKIKISAISSSEPTNVHEGDSASNNTTTGAKSIWYYSITTNINWSISTFDNVNYVQYLTAIEDDKNCDLGITFERGKFLIEYFEMGAQVASRKKIITVK
jgi:hypothetical protein